MDGRRSHSLPEELVEHILSFLSSADRNAASLVSKSWYDIDRRGRRHVDILNCHAVSPAILLRRFTGVRSITVKGKDYLENLEFVPKGDALPWIKAVAAAYPALEELRLYRMVVTDEGLELIATTLRNLRALEFTQCHGFSSTGLASIATNCRNLREVDITMEDAYRMDGDWISHFPDSLTSLEIINLQCLNKFKSKLPFSDIERLVARCPNLQALGINYYFTLDEFILLLQKIPRLFDLEFRVPPINPSPEALTNLSSAFVDCKRLKTLYVSNHIRSHHLPAIYPICLGLISLDLSNSFLHRSHLVELLHHCPNLHYLDVNYYIEDGGLEEVAASCKELHTLKVSAYDPLEPRSINKITERGLVSVAMNCPKLQHVEYSCYEMTNEALITIAKVRPNLTWFNIDVWGRFLKTFDDGLSTIVELCKNLKHLKIDCHFTDRLLEHIGNYGREIEVLQLVRGGGSDVGLHRVLSGCNRLQKLSMRDGPYSGHALVANSDRLERMRFVSMRSCKVSFEQCRQIGLKHPRLNVEIFNEKQRLISSMPDESIVANLYVYRTVAGPRLVNY